MTVGGDGGMITTDDEELANTARSLRDCGRASRYEMAHIGYTSRLNTVNAAIGRVQLKRLDKWNAIRRGIANLYRRELESVKEVTLPPAENSGETPVYHLFVIRSKYRDDIAKSLGQNGIESAIHYPVPIHLQGPYRQRYGFSEGSFPASEKLAREVLSLPMHPLLREDDVKLVCQTVREAVEQQS
jgi:dTDP-4-amino-4,6-dideoxygalactose transaminase